MSVNLLRFVSKVNKGGAFSDLIGSRCWEWTGATTSGYGVIRLDGNGRLVRAHRAAYEMYVGAIPDGLQIDHLCRRRCCVNPYHLEPVTQAENIRRGGSSAAQIAKWAAMTHCRSGHERTPDNTHITPKGQRVCRVCQRAARRRRSNPPTTNTQPPESRHP